MVDLCPIVKWSGIQMVGLKTGLKKPVYGQNCLVFQGSANRPWWPSGLSRRSNSSRVAAEDPE